MNDWMTGRMTGRMTGWPQLWMSLFWLGVEAQQVIALRMLRLAAGGALAEREAARMITEKVAANSLAAMRIGLGADAETVARGYRKTVRANLRRLRRP
jgi:hypothetical protein